MAEGDPFRLRLVPHVADGAGIDNKHVADGAGIDNKHVADGAAVDNKHAADGAAVDQQPDFDATLHRHGVSGLSRARLSTLQINVGKRCNQACHHCHVDAGPKRTESMTRDTAERLVELAERCPTVTRVDITGGAPELNPNFRYLVRSMRALGREVIDRCNLTVLFERGMEDLPEFLGEQGARVVASLPCYGRDNVDAQRGRGVFDKSVDGLRALNEVGYGAAGSGLVLDLVYNPVGAFLPPAQQGLERDYRRELEAAYGIRFNSLLTLTNMPIKRFAHMLHRDGDYARYMELLLQSFNPATVEHLMCRSQVSVGYDGALYDCDFNQMLELPLRGDSGRPETIWTIAALDDLGSGSIATGSHCLGCTAGAGSSCGGALQ